MNKVIITGRLTADPELKMTNSEKHFTTFTVAVDSAFKNQNGEKQTNFLPVVAWEKTAEFVTKWFRKGKPILVEGSINVRSYTDNNGAKRYVTEINASNVEFCGDSKTENAQGNNYSQNDFNFQKQSEIDNKSSGFEPLMPGDDLPF